MNHSSIVDADTAAYRFDAAEAVLRRLVQPISFLAVLGMLAIALITVYDVVIRWLTGTSIVAFNEIVAMVFAVALAATLPGGAASRVNLKVDLVGNLVSSGLRMWLELFGSALMVVFFAVLGRELFLYAQTAISRGRETTVLEWPVGPFMYAVSAFIVLAALVQFALLVLDGLRLARGVVETDEPPRTTSPWMKGMLVLVVGTLAGLGILTIFDFEGLSIWVQQNPGWAVGGGFVLLWLTMLAMVPVSATMALVGVSLCAFYLGPKVGLGIFASEAVGFLTNPQVAALPLFLMMGSFATVAGLADDVYSLAQSVLGRFRGGLALATVGGCAGLGAVTGSSLATTATFGKIAIPQMRKRGYSIPLATGCVAAGGTLGALIPPSAPLILFALLTEISIGALFIAAVIPGVIALLFYLATIGIIVWRNPEAAPKGPPKQPGERRAALRRSGPVLTLFGVVLGGMYSGIFTATESAAVGAVLAAILALWRGALNRDVFWKVMSDTTSMTAMIYGLIFGALAFSFVVGLSQVPDFIITFIGDLNVAPLVVIALLLVVYLLLGSVMDSFAVMIITVPVVTPWCLSWATTWSGGVSSCSSWSKPG